MRKIVIVGGGNFGRELLSWAQAASAAAGDIEVIGYVDDAGPAMKEFSNIRIPYLGDVTSLVTGDILLALAVGDPQRKKKVADALSARGARFATLVHPSAIIASDAQLNDGAVIGPLTYIATNSVVGALAVVNSLCGIGHDARIGAFSTISSQVDITGSVRLGEAVFVGSGARVLPGLRIGDGARIGAGAVVTRNVKEGQTLFAPAARIL